MNPRQNLRQDHGRIMQMLLVFQKARTNFGRHAAWIEQLEDLLEFARVYIDRCHHAKEEDILFPVLKKLPDAAAGELVSLLCREHRTGHALMEAIQRQFSALKNQPDLSCAELIRLSERYITLYRQHIRKENARLLPLLETHIPAEVQDHVMTQFHRLESENVLLRRLRTSPATLKPSADKRSVRDITAKK